VSPRREILAEGVELWLGDCREVLPLIGPVDAVVTDPPYGIGLEYSEAFSDDEAYVLELVKTIIPWAEANAKRTLITSGNQCQHLYPRPKWTLAWVTPAGAGSGPWGFSCWQPILAYGSCPYLASGKGRRHDIFMHTEASEPNGHPCPKPIRFMERLVERAALVGDLVCDPFMGSGTTGAACVKQGRRFVGVEIEPRYFDIACRRISDALKAPDLFIPTPAPKAKQESLL